METIIINDKLVIENYLNLYDFEFLKKLVIEEKLTGFQEKCVDIRNEKFKMFINKLDIDFVFSDEAEINYFDNTRIDLLIESINELKKNSLMF